MNKGGSANVVKGRYLTAKGFNLVGGDEVGVDVERGSAKAATKDAVQVKHEARTNLYERTLLLFILHDLQNRSFLLDGGDDYEGEPVLETNTW